MSGSPQSENKFLSFFENSLSGIILGSPDGKVLEANTAALEMFGYTLEEMKTSGRQLLFDDTDPAMIEALKTREKEGKVKCELIGIRKNGERLFCEVSSAIFKIENGELRTSTVLNDITERKKAEKETKLLLDNTEESFIVVDKSLRIVFFNKQFNNQYKKLLNKDVKKGDFILYYAQPERVNTVNKIYERVLNGETIEDEIIIKSDLGVFTFLNRYKPAVDINGSVIGAFVSIRDFAEKRRAEEILRSHEIRFQSIIEHSKDLISLVDSKGKFIYISPSMERFLGMPADDVVNKYYNFIIHTDDRVESKLILQKLLKNPGVPIPRTVRFLNKNGNSIWVEGVITNLLHDENVRAIVANYRDISEKINNNILKEFEQRNKEALINSTTDLIWSVSDDFKLITGNKAFIDLSKNTLDCTLKQGDDLLNVDIFGREHVAFWKRLYVRALNGESFKEEVVSKNKIDDSKTWTETSFNPIIHNNLVIGVVCDSRDITEMKRTYELLQLSEDKLKQKHEQLIKLTDNVDAVIYQFQIAPNGKMTCPFISKSISILVPEIDIETLKVDASPAFQTVHPDDLNSLMLSIEDSKNNLTHWDYEYRSIKSDKLKWIKASSHPYKSNDGTIVWYGYLIDITNQKMKEEQLRTSNERYNIIAKATNDTIWDADLITGKVIWNKGIQGIYGYKSDELEMSDRNWWYSKLHPDDRKQIIKDLEYRIAYKVLRWEQEYRFLCANNTYKHVYDRGFLVVDKYGTPIRMIGAMQDITMRKKEEHHLKLLESVITNTTDSVMITEAEPFDEPGPKIVYVNDAFTRMTGYTAEEVIGKSHRILQGPKSDKKELKKLHDAMKKWKSCEITIINYKKNGEEFWINFSITPVANEKGWYTHWIAIERDVTNVKLNDLEKEQIILELSQNNNDLKQFSYVLSHNLRSPIANLLGLTSLIDHNKIQDQSLIQILKGIRQSAISFDETIKDLSQVLIIKDQKNIVIEKISVLKIIKKVVKQLGLVNNQDLNIECDFDFEAFVKFPKAYLESIIMNLFTNAIKYKSSERKLNIRISLIKMKDFIVMKFNDNGIGIDTELHNDKLFKLYQRFHAQSEGKGLGLYLIKTQLEALGGNIVIESEVNVGTTFTIWFKD